MFSDIMRNNFTLKKYSRLLTNQVHYFRTFTVNNELYSRSVTALKPDGEINHVSLVYLKQILCKQTLTSSQKWTLVDRHHLLSQCTACPSVLNEDIWVRFRGKKTWAIRKHFSYLAGLYQCFLSSSCLAACCCSLPQQIAWVIPPTPPPPPPSLNF